MFYGIESNSLVLVESNTYLVPRLSLQPVTGITARYFQVGKTRYSKKTGREFNHMRRKAYAPSYIWENIALREKLFPSEIFQLDGSMDNIHYANVGSKKRKLTGKEMVKELERFLKSLDDKHNYIFSTSDVFEDTSIESFVDIIKTNFPKAEVKYNLIPEEKAHPEFYIEFKVIQAPYTTELKSYHLTFVGTNKQMDLLVCAPDNSNKVDLGLTAIEAYDKQFHRGHFSQIVKVNAKSDLETIVNDWWLMSDIQGLSQYTKTFLEALENV